MIEISGLTKRYNSFIAVNNLNLKIRAGEVFGFLGVNGAGKTTTLRMLAGILKPSAGSISICNFDMASTPDKAKAITGFIPDRPHLYNKLTAREFLKFIGDLYKVPRNEISTRSSALLEEYRLSEWENELTESFSHGMKQRLATCAALIHNPKLLIVDEPMVGLDPHGAKLLKEAFRRYAKAGMTILLSTHSLNVAEEVSDTLAIINKGSLLATGDFHQIREFAGAQEANLEQIFLELTSSSYQ